MDVILPTSRTSYRHQPRHKVVKGGKNLSFSALVVVGDSRSCGIRHGKAREVPMAIKKGIEQAKKNLIKLNMKGTTIPTRYWALWLSASLLKRLRKHRRHRRRPSAQGDAVAGSRMCSPSRWVPRPAQRGQGTFARCWD